MYYHLSHTDKPVIGVDIDNVIASTDMKIRELICRYFNICADIEDVQNWDYAVSLHLSPDEEKFIFDQFHQNHLVDLLPLPGAQMVLDSLSRNYSVWLLTSRPDYTRNDTIQWLSNNLIPYENLIFTERKINFIGEISCLIEDNPSTSIEFAQAGKSVLLFDYPWNRTIEHPFVSRISGWDQVLAQIELLFKNSRLTTI